MKNIFKIGLVGALVFVTFSSVHASPNELGKEVLGKKDGWAAYGEGTTGGSKADHKHIYRVSTKDELIDALGGENSKNGLNDIDKIIYVEDTIELNVDENNNPIGPEYYKDPNYDFNDYLATYAPEVWGYEREVSGSLEDARKRSQQKQKKEIVINIGSNTSIIGLDDDAKIIGGSLMMSGVENIIIRNIEFEAPLDYFPQWDPTDGNVGEWNSEYDNVSITNGTHHVWIDHNTFSDGENHDQKSGTYFGRLYQQHDGLLDITNGANYVTVSYNVFKDHDKVSIIGSSDSKKSDREHLKVTLHHNHYKNLTQRLPRVRFGEVHVYNNFYEFTKHSDYQFDYAFGVGVESKIYAENNYFKFDYEVDPATIIKNWKGSSIYESGSYVNGKSKHHKVDLLDVHNKSNVVKLNENVNWKPFLFNKIQPTQSVPAQVMNMAGAGQLH